MNRQINRMYSNLFVLINFIIHQCIIKGSSASGFFEVIIFTHQSEQGDQGDGGYQMDTDHSDRTQLQINMICLKELKTPIFTYPCTFGYVNNTKNGINYSSPIINFHHQINQIKSSSSSSSSQFSIHFTFRWIPSFTLIIDFTPSIHLRQRQLHSSSAMLTVPSKKWIIQETRLLPTNYTMNMFQEKRMESGGPLIKYRVYCDHHYYGDDCSSFCRPRDDTFGHYTCDSRGQKICLHGYTNVTNDCISPICLPGCHGHCVTPFTCECRNGYKGSQCQKCIEYPGCLHGYCLSPWQCICYSNWGGILCDQNLNSCGSNPCLNGGLCINSSPNEFKCECKKGFSGVNCEKSFVVNPEKYDNAKRDRGLRSLYQGLLLNMTIVIVLLISFIVITLLISFLILLYKKKEEDQTRSDANPHKEQQRHQLTTISVIRNNLNEGKSNKLTNEVKENTLRIEAALHKQQMTKNAVAASLTSLSISSNGSAYQFKV